MVKPADLNHSPHPLPPKAFQKVLDLLPPIGRESAIFKIIEAAEEETNSTAQAIKSEGFSIQLKQCLAYWHEDLGILVSGKATTQYKQQVLKVMRTCWLMHHVAQCVDIKLDGLAPEAQETMKFELKMNPMSLKRLPEISEKLYQLRLFNMLLVAPQVNGSDLMRESTQLRILFNEIADEELEIWDYYDAVQERLEQYQEHYEAWHEKLVEYRSFFYEAILEILIIVILFLDYLMRRG